MLNIRAHLGHDPADQTWAYQSHQAGRSLVWIRFSATSHVHFFSMYTSSDRATACEQNFFTDLKPNTWLSKARSWFPSSFGKCWLMLSLLHWLHAKSFVSLVCSVELSVCRKLTWPHFPLEQLKSSSMGAAACSVLPHCGLSKTLHTQTSACRGSQGPHEPKASSVNTREHHMPCAAVPGSQTLIQPM